MDPRTETPPAPLDLPGGGDWLAWVSQRCQDLITMLCTSLYGARQEDEMARDAADILCQHLTQKYTGRRASNAYYRQVTELGAAIADGGFKSLEGIEPGKIMMPYG